ncbi:hypothetical protein DL98DRAFT_523394 [Cadophora sp. DSE1049]|nr:hypothetical protein DL98DRAFT_523394 [Cadophora sp. DSE1049]
MPSPVPSGALAVAYRRICIRCVRSLIKDPGGNCSFDDPASKKCAHCAKKKEKCHPIPSYVAEEFDELLLAGDDHDGITAAAAKIDAAIRVADGEAPRGQEELLAALLEETRALRREMHEMNQNQFELLRALGQFLAPATPAPAPAPAPATPSGSKRKAAAGGGSGKRARGPGGKFVALQRGDVGFVEGEGSRPGGAVEEDDVAAPEEQPAPEE